MSIKGVVFLALIGSAGVAAHRAGGTPVTAANVDAKPVIAESVPQRVRQGIGVFGSRLADRPVRSMTRDTERSLAELNEAIRKSRGVSKTQAQKAARRVMALDSAAIRSLEAGHPVTAFKLAMQGRGLVDAVRENVLEEAVIR